MNKQEIKKLLEKEDVTAWEACEVLSHFRADDGRLLSAQEITNGELWPAFQNYKQLVQAYRADPEAVLAAVVERGSDVSLFSTPKIEGKDQVFYAKGFEKANTGLSLVVRKGTNFPVLALEGHVIPGQTGLSWSKPNRWGIREVHVIFEVRETSGNDSEGSINMK